LVIDMACLIALIIGFALRGPRVEAFLAARTPIPVELTRWATWAVFIALALPFLVGIFRIAARLAEQLARAALPAHGRLDRAAAPRQALVITFEIAIVFLVGLPVLAISQPFLPPFRGAVVLIVVLVLLGVLAWRSARNLHGHVSAGSEVLLAASRHSLPPEQATQWHAIAGARQQRPI